jgi:predicted small lipoprotein YifL
MKKALALLTISFCVSCGIKGPPLPPVDESVARKQKAESVTVSNPVGQTSLPVSADGTKAKKIKK